MGEGKLVGFARTLRRHQTDAEQKLWFFLRSRRFLGYKFRRQHPIGSFIVDFCCIEQKLIIEIDGGQHAEIVEDDTQRTHFFETQGYRVLRFWNHDTLQNTEAISSEILKALTSPHPRPLPARERE